MFGWLVHSVVSPLVLASEASARAAMYQWAIERRQVFVTFEF
jgi:hypothetical protein